MTKLRDIYESLPLAMRIGFSVIALGFILDLAFHAGAMTGAAAELVSHFVTLIGMVVVIGYLISRAFTRPVDAGGRAGTDVAFEPERINR